MANHPDRTELLHAALTGDTCALGELLDSYRTELDLLARNWVGPQIRQRTDVSDILQEAFLAAYSSFPAFAGDTIREFESWLYSIVRERSNKTLRRSFAAKRDIRKETNDTSPQWADCCLMQRLPSASPSPSEIAFRREIFAAVEQLPKRSADVLRRHLVGYSNAEIASEIQSTTGSVAGIIYRAVMQLRAHFSRQTRKGAKP